MRIKISQRLRPFSHLPGVRCLIPYTTWELQAFPAKLYFRNLSGTQVREKELPIVGPVSGWTLVLDLERGRVEVFGRGKKGYFRTLLSADNLSFLKVFDLPKNGERLSLGVHKKQDWDLVKRRRNMGEIFPFILRLSHLIPETALPKKPVGVLNLLPSRLFDVFVAGFQGILSPRLSDENHLGLIPSCNIPKEVSPLCLIHQMAKDIRALFFYERERGLSILPKLPQKFHAGRFIGYQTTIGDQIDIEWSKKQIKKMVILPNQDRPVPFTFQKGIRSFRLRESARERGIRVKHGAALSLETGKKLFLDRFQR